MPNFLSNSGYEREPGRIYRFRREVRIDSVYTQGPYCPGGQVQLRAVTYPLAGPLNEMIIELSDSAGRFTAPLVLGSVASRDTANLTIQLPENLPPGLGYKLRLVITDPERTGTLCTSPELTILPKPRLQLAVNQPLCTGDANGEITGTATGGTPPLSWNFLGQDTTPPPYAGLSAGLNPVVVADANGCSDALPLQLADPVPLAIDSLRFTRIAPRTATLNIFATGGTPGYQYSLTGDAVTIQNQLFSTFPNLPEGTYTLTLTDANGCTFDSTFTWLDPTTTRTSYASADALRIYPNPTAGELVVSWAIPLPQAQDLLFINALGQTVHQQSLQKGDTSTNLRLPALPAGVYLLRLGQRTASVVVE
jgi:hypothetical protein